MKPLRFNVLSLLVAVYLGNNTIGSVIEFAKVNAKYEGLLKDAAFIVALVAAKLKDDEETATRKQESTVKPTVSQSVPSDLIRSDLSRANTSTPLGFDWSGIDLNPDILTPMVTEIEAPSETSASSPEQKYITALQGTSIQRLDAAREMIYVGKGETIAVNAVRIESLEPGTYFTFQDSKGIEYKTLLDNFDVGNVQLSANGS